MNSAADDPSGSTPGVQTLRDAIIAVNNDTTDSASNPDIIKFAIAGTPAITLGADLPAINRPVTIDGSSQSGVTVNGNGFAMLVDNSTVTVTDATFSGGTVNLGSSRQFDRQRRQHDQRGRRSHGGKFRRSAQQRQSVRERRLRRGQFRWRLQCSLLDQHQDLCRESHGGRRLQRPAQQQLSVQQWHFHRQRHQRLLPG